MKAHSIMRFSFVLPLPRFVTHPLTAVALAVLHVYLASGHLGELVETWSGLTSGRAWVR